MLQLNYITNIRKLKKINNHTIKFYFLLSIFLCILFPSNLNWSAITSKINTTDIIIGDNKVYAATEGGIVIVDILSNNISEISFDDGLYPLDLSSISEGCGDYILSVSSSPKGVLQRIDLSNNYIDKVDHLDWNLYWYQHQYHFEVLYL